MKAECETFSFVVPLEYEPTSKPPVATSWIKADGSRTEVEAEAVRFTFHLYPTMPEELQIERSLDDVMGGIADVVDLEQGIERLRARLQAKYEAAVWPAGKPKAETPADRVEQQALIEAQFQADSSTDRAALKRMERLREVNRVCAEWAVLIVDPPEGWEDLANRQLRPGSAEAIVETYSTVKYAELTIRGK